MEWCFYSLLILFGVWLRVWRFWEPSLWLDELITAYDAGSPDWATLWHRCGLGNQAPLYPLLAGWLLALGKNEFFLRLPSVVFGIATIGFLMAAVWRVLGARAALYAGALLALSSRAIFHAQEARMYSMALFAAAASLYFLIRSVESSSVWPRLGYAITGLLAAYSHLIYSSVLLVQMAVVAATRFSASGAENDRLRSLQRLQIGMLLLLAPLVPWYLAAGAARRVLASWYPPPRLYWILHLKVAPESVLVWFAALLCLPRLWKRRRRLEVLPGARERILLGVAAGYLATVPVALGLAALGWINILLPRFLLASLLGTVILVVFVVSRANDSFLRLALWTLMAAIAAVQGLVAYKDGPWIAMPQQDWRGAITWIEDRYQPGDAILLRPWFVEVNTLPPGEPYLTLPLRGLYGRRRDWNIIILPWRADELEWSPHTAAQARQQVHQAGRVFVLMDSFQWADRDWRTLERWMDPSGRRPGLLEERSFEQLKVRVYRLAGPT